MPSRFKSSFVAVAALAALAAATPALAGPPLLCHPYDIAGARSLPWQDGAASWEASRSDYPLERLTNDTLALLAPETPIVVRMETLRRAAIYSARDPQAGARLFTALTARAEAAQGGKAGALAYLDAAYYVEAIRQMAAVAEMSRSKEFGDRGPALRAIAQGSDGYALAAKALAARPGDPAMEFAAALISLDRHRDAYARHAENARAGIARDTLLARNIGHVQ